MRDGALTLAVGVIALIVGVAFYDWRAGLIVAGVLGILGAMFIDVEDEQ